MSFRVTEKERDIIRRKADISHYGREKYLRHMALEGYIYQQDLSNISAFINAVSKVGTNINQIAKHANEVGGVTCEEMKEVRHRLEDIWHIIRVDFII